MISILRYCKALYVDCQREIIVISERSDYNGIVSIEKEKGCRKNERNRRIKGKTGSGRGKCRKAFDQAGISCNRGTADISDISREMVTLH